MIPSQYSGTDEERTTVSAWRHLPAWSRFVLVFLILSIAVACGGSATPTPALVVGDVLKQSAEAMGKASTAHFTLIAEDKKQPMVLGPGLAATSIEGDVVAPDKAKIKVSVNMQTVSASVDVIAVGAKQYLTNPLTGQWQDVSGTLAIPALLDSQRGVSVVLNGVEQAELVGRANEGGTETYYVRGRIPTAVLATLIGGQAIEGDPVAGEFWIGTADFRVRKVTLTGAIIEGEAAGLRRTIVFSNYDQAMTIEAPIK